MILPATNDDIPSIVHVHLESFPGFFLTFLGKRFLTLFYQSVLEEYTGCFYVFKEQGEVKGFVCGTSNPSGFFRRLLRRKLFSFAAASLFALLRRPSIVRRLLRSLSYPAETTIGEHNATLMSIAVLPSAQGKHIGRELVHAFLSEMKRRTMNTVDLTTDRFQNDNVNAFYLRLGFHLKRTFVTPEGREMNEYVIEV
jgi:ribosomal protein S18 acetylase RimI-like enzyme